MTRLALGFRAHIGWAVGVLLAEPAEPAAAPVVMRRFRLDLVDPDKLESREPFHAARRLSLVDAETLIDQASRTVGTLARAALTNCIEGVPTSGIVGACVIASSAKPRDLQSTLRSHVQVHVAEGDQVAWNARFGSVCARLEHDRGVAPPPVVVPNCVGAATARRRALRSCPMHHAATTKSNVPGH